MAKSISRTIRNATWTNIETKVSVNCEILVNLDDGSTQVFEAVVSRPDDGSFNEDWEFIMERFGIEGIDAATTKEVQESQIRKDELRLAEEDSERRKAEYEKQEALFAYKLESFEIPAVKNSTDRAIKALIRKSKSIPEVQAYTTILLAKELKIAQETLPTAE